MKATNWVVVLGVLALTANLAMAGADLKVTEIYEGVSGEDVTEDWFELTNFGDAAWDLSTNPLWYDDSPSENGKEDPINGISSIAPGESVIVVIDEADSIQPFIDAWGLDANVVQVGYADGSGLGQGDPGEVSADGVNVFDNQTFTDGDPGNIASQTYGYNPAPGSTFIYNPWTGTFGDNAAEDVLGAWKAGTAGDSGEYDLVGSPGVVPEPATMALFGLGGLAALIRRRRA